MKYLLFFSMSLISLAVLASTKPQVQAISAAQQKSAPEFRKGGAGPSGVPAEQKVNAEPVRAAHNANAAAAANNNAAAANNNTVAATMASFGAMLDKKLHALETEVYKYIEKHFPNPTDENSDDEDNDSIKATAKMMNKKKDRGAAAW